MGSAEVVGAHQAVDSRGDGLAMTHPKVDWSKAPEWAVAWSISHWPGGERHGWWTGPHYMDEAGSRWWGFDSEIAPLFGYRGTVENSLTLRPPKRKKMSKADGLRLEHGMTA